MYWGYTLGPYMFWIFIAVIVIGTAFFRYLSDASRHRAMRDIAQSGQPIPPEMFRSSRGSGSLYGGFFMLFIGIALVIFMWVLSGHMHGVEGEEGVPRWLPVVGVFPIAIGLSLILGRLMDRRDNNYK